MSLKQEVVIILCLLVCIQLQYVVVAFTFAGNNNDCQSPTSLIRLFAVDDNSQPPAESSSKKDNKAMAFLRKLGKVGTGQDFTNAMGVDEGPVGRSKGSAKTKAVRKAKSAYKSCIDSGIVDDMSEDFPITSSGTLWSGFTDQVMGGVSFGSLTREIFQGRTANVLRGKVSLANNGGFIQMATDLALDPAVSQTVDASKYDGIEIDVQCQEELADDDEEGGTNKKESKESFNIHLKNSDCSRQFSSYRATFDVPIGEWETVRLPWNLFQGKGPGAEDSPLDLTTLRRLGVVAIGKEMAVVLAVSGLRFYNDV